MAERTFLPRESGLGLRRIANKAGLDFSVLPNGCILRSNTRKAAAALC